MNRNGGKDYRAMRRCILHLGSIVLASAFVRQPSLVATTQKIQKFKNPQDSPLTATVSSGATPLQKQSDFDLDQWQAGSLTSFSQTVFAEYWDDLPTIRENDRVDVYDFFQRMAMEKVLIEETGGERVWGTSSLAKCSQHPVWGYAAQLDWQRRSGRFEDPANWKDNPGVVFETIYPSPISKRSWWGYMNLNFCVAKYCGAAEAGLVPQIVPTDESLATDQGFLDCVGIWKGFWEYYKAFLLDSNSSSSITEEQKDTLYRMLWQAHTDVILTKHHASRLEELLPQQDRDAGLGWGTMVELLAATNWPLLSLDSLCKFGGGYLPTVRLAGPKSLAWLKDSRPMEYTTVSSLYQLKETPARSMHMSCLFFGRVARWRFVANNLPRSLHILTHGNPIQKTLALFRLILVAAIPRSLFEQTKAVVDVGRKKIAKRKQVLFGAKSKPN